MLHRTARNAEQNTLVRHIRRRFVVLATVLAILVGLLPLGILPARAEGTAEPAPTDSRIGVVYLCNLENDLVLYEQNADRAVYPSSSVKIMTGLLACRALAERLEESVTVTGAMVAGIEGRKLHLADGEVLTVRDLLYAAICGSYNDAAAVLACLSSGSVSAFVSDMNREAERLGLSCTRYTNPTGLHDPAMSTSAKDVAIIAREAYANELYMTVSSARTYTIPATNVSESRLLTNRNALISDSSRNYYNGYCRGLSVGMTDEGGWCVVTVCEKGGANNLCIVMRGADVDGDELIPAYTYTNRLLNWAGRAYTYRTVLEAGDTVKTVPVEMTGISKSEAKLTAKEPLAIYLPAEVEADVLLDFSVTLTDGALTAPLSAGQVVGSVAVLYEGHVVGRTELTVGEDFARSSFLDGLMGFREYLCSRAFWIAVMVFLALLLPFLHMTSPTKGRYGIRSTRRRRIRYTKRRY